MRKKSLFVAFTSCCVKKLATNLYKEDYVDPRRVNGSSIHVCTLITMLRTPMSPCIFSACLGIPDGFLPFTSNYRYDILLEERKGEKKGRNDGASCRKHDAKLNSHKKKAFYAFAFECITKEWLYYIMELNTHQSINVPSNINSR